VSAEFAVVSKQTILNIRCITTVLHIRSESAVGANAWRMRWTFPYSCSVLLLMRKSWSARFWSLE